MKKSHEQKLITKVYIAMYALFKLAVNSSSLVIKNFLESCFNSKLHVRTSF